jgi:hypothetical protein
MVHNRSNHSWGTVVDQRETALVYHRDNNSVRSLRDVQPVAARVSVPIATARCGRIAVREIQAITHTRQFPHTHYQVVLFVHLISLPSLLVRSGWC